jgi:hypothetical protein
MQAPIDTCGIGVGVAGGVSGDGWSGRAAGDGIAVAAVDGLDGLDGWIQPGELAARHERECCPNQHALAVYVDEIEPGQAPQSPVDR